jgi:hypothetical protein
VVEAGVVGVDLVVYYAYPSFLERSNAAVTAIDNRGGIEYIEFLVRDGNTVAAAV